MLINGFYGLDYRSGRLYAAAPGTMLETTGEFSLMDIGLLVTARPGMAETAL